MTKREAWEAFVKEIDGRIKMMGEPALHAIRPSEADAIVKDIPLMFECVDALYEKCRDADHAMLNTDLQMLLGEIEKSGLHRAR